MFSSLIAVSTIGVVLSTGEVDASDDGPSPGDIFSDCDNCPEMIVVPAGGFAMGASETDGERQARESPQHEVTIPEPFAVGKFEVTRGQFAEFVTDRGWKTQDACGTYENEGWEVRPGRTWRDPGFPQDATHPVNCVTFDDARGYVAWLSEKTGHDYRLLSEAEWEYAARGGATTVFSFGEEEAALCQNANGADKSAQALFPTWTWANSCDDGHPFTAPVGTYRPNAFGLHDMTGNVWEWVSDCFHESYDGAPNDGASWEAPYCPLRVSRGGGLFDSPGVLRLTFRGKATPESLDFESGFRVARTIDQQQ